MEQTFHRLSSNLRESDGLIARVIDIGQRQFRLAVNHSLPIVAIILGSQAPIARKAALMPLDDVSPMQLSCFASRRGTRFALRGDTFIGICHGLMNSGLNGIGLRLIAHFTVLLSLEQWLTLEDVLAGRVFEQRVPLFGSAHGRRWHAAL
jgi:hypothetical protein